MVETARLQKSYERFGKRPRISRNAVHQNATPDTTQPTTVVESSIAAKIPLLPLPPLPDREIYRGSEAKRRERNAAAAGGSDGVGGVRGGCGEEKYRLLPRLRRRC
ncbi:hypothetical protein GUJ93_ZPchr0001g30330 [Zizania palustris]|uniref:Uncharacterized protein n=1 Tax=Zizania palustris TaxID=103762 RepID=A0A8J5RW33_ZIZPA|nr:hypothetical protein GUJ93_ZPchr0001g30330 [Zizania palustris]